MFILRIRRLRNIFGQGSNNNNRFLRFICDYHLSANFKEIWRLLSDSPILGRVGLKMALKSVLTLLER